VPVTLLYCEGAEGRPDVRVLSRVLSGPCMVKPHGGKYDLDDRIRVAREVHGANVAGLRDRDFDFDAPAVEPTLSPIKWVADNGRLWLGWCWERVEIENYLIDPVVVTHALGPHAPALSDYQSALQTAAETIADYTAARMALSQARRVSSLSNCWGPKRSLDDHHFPDDLDLDHCRNAIRQTVEDYGKTKIVQVDEVVRRFETIRPECQVGGLRFQHFLTYFSGKDLLLAMQADLARLGFVAAHVFRERLLGGIQKSSDDIWSWLPEWQQLRTQVQTA
jgi:hypothetical protein